MRAEGLRVALADGWDMVALFVDCGQALVVEDQEGKGLIQGRTDPSGRLLLALGVLHMIEGTHWDGDGPHHCGLCVLVVHDLWFFE
ncbi:hypothetical protein JY96_20940 [Aquabacterium sp. NJ1]|nr:hypothetical protein JY96_20940 [Aquabacterium sp. NJ1]